MKRALVLTWLFIFSGSIVSFGQKISDEAKRYYDRGCVALEMIENNEFADYEDAIKEFNKAKEAAPDFKNVYFKLGQIYSKLEKYQEAIENYKKYIQLETDTNEVSQIKTIINKLEYKSEKKRELMPSTYKDVNVGDFVTFSLLASGYIGSYDHRTITVKCIGKYDSFVKLEISQKILVASQGEITRNEFKTNYITYSISEQVGGYVGGYSIENFRELSKGLSDEKKIADGLRYLKIDNITFRCYWSKTKSCTGAIIERWFSNKIPLVYLVKQIITFDGKELKKEEVISWGRGGE